MISGLKGRVVGKYPNFVQVMLSNGLAYYVNIKSQDFQMLDVGKEAFLFTSLVIKEDSHDLYGFLDYKDMLWFNSLKKTSGVGPKTALNVLNAVSVGELENLINSKADNHLASLVSGIGKKTATKLIADLEKDGEKIQNIIFNTQFDESFEQLNSYSNKSENKVKQTSDGSRIILDAVSALVNLGYDKERATLMAREIFYKNTKISLENLILDLLKLM